MYDPLADNEIPELREVCWEAYFSLSPAQLQYR